MKTVTTIGLDIAKSVFQVHGIDAAGKVVIRKQLKRGRVLPFFMKLPPCLVGIEACASSHYWARQLTALGHDVKLMPPAYVKPYVKRQKNDAADAEAICESVQRPNMRFVPIKSPEQQAGLALHRTRHLLIRQLTATTNSIRAHLAELGIVAPVGRRGVDALIALVRSDEDGRIPALMRACLMTLSLQAQALKEQIRILVADPKAFRCGRDFAAWIGLVPKQNSSGGRERLGNITKAGDRYIRSLFCAGALAVIRFVKIHGAKHRPWLTSLMDRRPIKVAAIALANKLARMAWALMAKGESYKEPVALAR